MSSHDQVLVYKDYSMKFLHAFLMQLRFWTGLQYWMYILHASTDEI